MRDYYTTIFVLFLPDLVILDELVIDIDGDAFID